MKVAVLLAGQLRTWRLASPYIFSYFENLNCDIDYFLATWDTTRDFWWPEEHSKKSERSVDPQIDICDIFKKYNKNLINFAVIPMIARQDISFYYQAHLARLCNDMKQFHEKVVGVYDQVIETRPDVLPIGNAKNFGLLKPLHFSSAAHWTTTDGLPQANDFFFRSDSKTNDIISRRDHFNLDHEKGTIIPESSFGNHYVLAKWLEKNGLKKDHTQHDFEDLVIYRPNFPKNIHELPIEEIKQLDCDWVESQWAGYY